MGTTQQTLRFFWKYTKRYPLYFGLGFLNIIQSTINGAITPLLLGIGTGKLVDPQSTGLSFAQILGLIAGASLIALTVNRIALSSINKYEVAATRDISNDIATHILSESYDFHTKNFSGSLINKAVKLSSSYITFIDTMMLDTMRNSVIILMSIVIIAVYDLPLAGIMAVLGGLGIGSTVYLTRKFFYLHKRGANLLSDQTAYLADIVTNATTVKTFAAEDYELQVYDRATTKYSKALLKGWSKQLDANTFRMAIAITMNLSVLAYGIYGIQHGFLPTAIFVTAQLYAIRITNSFWDLTGVVRNLERVFADAHEMVEIMNQPLTLIDAADAQPLKVSKGSLTFDAVTFHYNDADQSDAVLTDFSLTIKPGEKIGLVGRSGGGKTTITKLALRFMDIQKGSISIDGQNIAQVPQADLRRSISYVPQEPLLFHRSLKENIGYGNLKATEQAIHKAAKLSHADAFINEMPHGYNTLVGERGVKLSGGQRQRVAIARALLKDAPILILDEATSALDSESEVMIQDALWKLMEGRTAIVIAHRLSTIQKMDRIIVMDNGKIAEQGTHQELLKKKGVYAKLWAHQSGGFLED